MSRFHAPTTGRLQRLFLVFMLAIGPVAWSASGCSKKEEPAPTPAVEEPEEKPKKKKKKTDDEDTTDVGAATGDMETGAPTVVGGAGGGKVVAKSDSGASDADKAKLIACCTALRNAAQAAGVASAAASAAPIPGMPAITAPPKEELDKSVKECDKQVANWNGDLNESLKKVKGASPVKLPSACLM